MVARRRQGGSSTRRTLLALPGTAAVNPAAPHKGVSRPPAAPRSFGLGHGMAPNPAAGRGFSGGFGPAPGTPQATLAPPQTVASAAARTNAQQTLTGAQGDYRDAIWRAVMGLGDPSQFAKYQANPEFAGYQFTQDPNSAFSQVDREQALGLKNIDEGTLAGNTYFSGRRLNDRQTLTDEENRQRLGASTSFLDNLRTIAGTLTGAQGDYRQSMADADQADIDAVLQGARDNREALGGVAPQKGVVRPGTPPPTPSSAQRRRQARRVQRARR